MRSPLILVAIALSSPVWSQGQSQVMRDQCYGSTAGPDQVIAACGALIAPDQGKPSDQAKDYANRAYADLMGAASESDVRAIERLFSGDTSAAEAIYRLAQSVPRVRAIVRRPQP